MNPGPGTARDFDAIIVGSGPGGSAAALALTETGRSVLVVEKGRNHLIDLDDPRRLIQRYSNDEIKFGPRHFLGPDPIVEPRTFRISEADGDRVFVGEVNSVPATVGGGAVHADGKVPRFLEEDFRLLSERGPVEGAEVVDWPLCYDDLEPFYEQAEGLIGVSGAAGSNPFAAPRSAPYPMPGWTWSRWQCVSTPPGRTSSPSASMFSRPLRFSPTAAMRPATMPTSARRTSVELATEPPRMAR